VPDDSVPLGPAAGSGDDHVAEVVPPTKHAPQFRCAPVAQR
jgi:hypothetical protein